MNHAKHILLTMMVGLVLLLSGCTQEMEFFADTPYTFSYELLLINNQNYVKISPFAYPADQGYDCYYTIDGTDPISNGVLYSQPIQIESTSTIKAVLKKNDKVSSIVDTHVCELTKSAKPRLDLPNNYYSNNREYDSIIQINNSTWSIPPGTSIQLNIFNETEVHYTLDGTTPTLESPKYQGQILITNACTLKARSFPSSLAHFGPSDIFSIDFVARLKKPVFSVNSTRFMYDQIRPEISITSLDNAFISYIHNSSEDVRTSEFRCNYIGPINLDEYHDIDRYQTKLSKTYRITAIATGKDGYFDSLPVTVDYPILGQAGGFLILDKGSYSDGWRYLEVTPFRVTEKNGVFFCQTYEESLLDRTPQIKLFIFGYERNEQELELANYENGISNTEAIISLFGAEAYTSPDLWVTTTTPLYAAKACYELEYNGYDDWYLPTANEGTVIENASYNGLLYTGILGFWVFGQYGHPILGKMSLDYWYRYPQSGSELNSVLAVRRF